MKRKIVTAILIIVFFLLQTTVFQALTLASVAPNLLLILTASFGFMRGKKWGMSVGFFSGLLMDTLYGVGGMIGFYALMYLLTGFVNGCFRKMFYAEDIKLPVALIFASELMFGVENYFFLYLMRSKFDFLYYFQHVIMPELVYTILVTLIVYQLILKIDRKLEAEEKRSAGKFV